MQHCIHILVLRSACIFSVCLLQVLVRSVSTLVPWLLSTLLVGSECNSFNLPEFLLEFYLSIWPHSFVWSSIPVLSSLNNNQNWRFIPKVLYTGEWLYNRLFEWMKLNCVIWIRKQAILNEWMIHWMNEWIIHWMNESFMEWMNHSLNEWMIHWMNEWMNISLMVKRFSSRTLGPEQSNKHLCSKV